MIFRNNSRLKVGYYFFIFFVNALTLKKTSSIISTEIKKHEHPNGIKFREETT